MEEQVMTIKELAKYLKMKPVTIYKHLSENKLPGFKVGATWRFKKSTIDGWITEQENKNSNTR